ncbi:ESX secretion-associated protein EspG [Nocardia crassostreae]|uniref:ESX secretion-associated protein EspG n=1 Tax=Nocardia crassostreae TaxID=53428 RepID=UPI00082C5709|nr:ESX secretion-associated protein EspG [Nocardia crassostreae]
MKWEFTPDEFIHLWQQTRTDRYPFPLRLRSSCHWQDDHDQLTRALADRLPTDSDRTLTSLLRLAATPAISLSLTGTRRHPLRAYSAIDGNAAVTLVQRPSPDPDLGANVIIEAGTPSLVPKVFAAVTGSAAAGRLLSHTETRESLRRLLESTPPPTHPAAALRRLLTTPRTGEGHIAAHHALRSPAPATPEYLSWFDVPADGRYTYRYNGQRFAITPCSPETLAEHLTRLCDGHSV